MPPDKRLLIISTLLAILTFAAFWQVTRSEFINYYDDGSYVTENIYIQNGLTPVSIKWAFTTGHASNWHPLTWISHMMDVQLFALNPHWHHLMNLLFHIANTVLLFLILHRMTKALWQSVFVAALFALHPLHVESVAWVAERKDVLSTFFWMLTMGAYTLYAERPGLTRYLAVIICFVLGLMAKPMLVTLPFVLFLLDYWPLSRVGQNKCARVSGGLFRWPLISPLVIEKIPLLALATLSSVITYLVQQHGGAMGTIEDLPLGARIGNAVVSYITYIGKMFWPTDLAVLYPHPGWWPLWKVIGAAAFCCALTAAALIVARKRPYALVGWLWYVGTLVPTIGIVQVGAQAMADRYTYVPLIGMFIVVAWGVPDLLKNWPRRRQAMIALSGCCILGISVVTWNQVRYWRDSLSLYTHTLEVTDNNSIIYANRSAVYSDLGNYAQAIADCNKAIEINPEYAGAYSNRGSAYNNLGNYAQAIADFNKAIEINPRFEPAYSNRGSAYNSLGNHTQAIADFNKAIEINPRFVLAYANRGNVYNSLDDYAQAIADFNKAIEIDPKFALAYKNRGWARKKLADYTGAIADLDRAIEINPRFDEAYSDRGATRNSVKDFSGAIADLNKAIKLNPKNGEAYANRAVSYGSLGNREQAIADMKTAARLGYAGAKNFLKSQGIGW